MKLKSLNQIVVISACIALIVSILGCNPVKQVMRDPKRFDEVASEVIRRGYCVNDTTTITEVRDSIIYKDSIVERVHNIPCKDFDTVIGRSRVSVIGGVLSFKQKDSVVYRTKTVTNTVRDRTYEDTLKSDILILQSNLVRSGEQLAECQSNYKDKVGDLRNDKLKLWLVIVAMSIFILRKPIIKIVRGWLYFM